MRELRRRIPDTRAIRHEAVVQRQILELGTAVRAARLAHGWSQAELEQRSKVSQADISRIENGIVAQRGPTAVTLCRLAVALGLRIGLGPALEAGTEAAAVEPISAEQMETIVRRAVHSELEIMQSAGAFPGAGEPNE